MLSVFLATTLFLPAVGAQAQSSNAKTNINLAVASNFFGSPPSNSAITDVINAFEEANPNDTVTVVDNGATENLNSRIINGNQLGVDLFLAADTATPVNLVLTHPDLVSPFAGSGSAKLFVFPYAEGILALLSNTPGVDLSCATGTCGYDPKVYKTVAIADPSVAPYGVAAQTVLTGRYGLQAPLSSNSLVHEYPNITASFNAVMARTDPVGFVAMSSICSNGSFPTPGNGTSAFAYFTIQNTPQNPNAIVNNFNALTQSGVPINHQRDADQEAELSSFVAFMTDFTTSPSPNSPMVNTLHKFCYGAPLSLAPSAVTSTASTTTAAEGQTAATAVPLPASLTATGTVMGSSGGGFSFFTFPSPGNGSTGTITLTVNPTDPVTRDSVGVNVYQNGSTLASFNAGTTGTGPLGTNTASIPLTTAGPVLVQVFNYRDGQPANFTIAVSGPGIAA
jgi:molybdenum ABC transporter molybdate-binding protein